MTLTEFLLARIAEEESLAQEVLETHNVSSAVSTPLRTNPDAPTWALQVREFVNVWQPARVLAECEAKRRIVEGFTLPLYKSPWHGNDDEGFLSLEWAVKWLATPCADHPDYNPAWRP